MAFAVDDFVLGPGSVTEVAALVGAKIETYDDAKVVRHLEFIRDSRNQDEVVAVILIDT
jgi:hypothetical protein